MDPIVSNTRLSKVLMDSGSGLNILYADTLDAMGLGSPPALRGSFPRRCAWKVGDATRVERPAGNVWGYPHVRGGGLQGSLPRHFGAAMLREVHGSTQLHILEANDVRAARGHHRGIHLSACVYVGGGKLQVGLGSPRS